MTSIARRNPVRSTALGLLFAASFPFVLAAGVVYLLGLTARLAWTRPERWNVTPCGPTCRHAKQLWGGWRCTLSETSKCEHARREFTVMADPRNCQMFERAATELPRDHTRDVRA